MTPMAEIDRYSDTWRDTEQWLQGRREDRVQSLINGSAVDERLRGEIRLIDDLLAYASEEPEPESDIEPGSDY